MAHPPLKSLHNIKNVTFYYIHLYFHASFKTMFVILLTLAVLIQLGSASHHLGRFPHITTCKNIDGYRIFFKDKLYDQYGSCADPNGGNRYKSLRANSCDHCAELCKLTGGCNYWTWVPHFLEPNGHRHCKLYKNFCCFKPHYWDGGYSGEDKDGSKIRKSGSKFQKCPTY